MAKSKWPAVKEKLILVEAWCRDGLTEEQIAKNLGISVQTLNVYKKDHPEFLESLKRGKEVADIEVENALYKRAIGYKYDEVTKERVVAKDKYGEPVKDDNGAVITELKITKVVTKEVQPDTTAQIFWLKNRKPTEWRDKKEMEHNGSVPVKIVDDIE
jgi:transcriptional regulator with XRE-family HTH domain